MDLSTISLSDVISLFTGGKPGLVLGGVALQGHDSPNSMPFGTEQKVAVHDLPGGARVFDLTGAYPTPVAFSGVLQGSGAVVKARALEALAAGSRAVPLTWADFRRPVVVQSVECDYTRSGAEVPYRVSVLPLPAPAAARKVGALEAIGGDIAKALGVSDPEGALVSAQGALRTAQAAVPLVGAISPKLAAQVGGYLQAGSTVASGARQIAEGNLGGFVLAGSASVPAWGSGAVGLVPGLAGSSIVSRLTTAASAAGGLAAAVTAEGYLGRAQANVGAATS